MRTHAGPSRLRLTMYVLACVMLGFLTTLGIAWSCAAWVNAAGAPSVLTSSQLTPEEVEELIKEDAQANATVSATNINIIVPGNSKYRTLEPTGAYQTQTTQRAFGHTRINRLTSNMRFDVQNGSIFVGGTGSGLLRLSRMPYCETVDQAGWPFRAFECSMPTASITTPNVSITMSSGPNVLAGGLSLPPDASGRWRALPYRPRWIGLLANLALFSVLWFGVLLAPWIARRRKRRKRGKCIACGYDLRGVRSERCPECGYETGLTSDNQREARSEEEEPSDSECADSSPMGGAETSNDGDDARGGDALTENPPNRDAGALPTAGGTG